VTSFASRGDEPRGQRITEIVKTKAAIAREDGKDDEDR
jgi:hypothetical protein